MLLVRQGIQTQASSEGWTKKGLDNRLTEVQAETAKDLATHSTRSRRKCRP